VSEFDTGGRIGEIESFFAQSERDLQVSQALSGWFAAFPEKASRSGTAPYGYGKTKLEAIENAYQAYLGHFRVGD
jgi:hypothetical protein